MIINHLLQAKWAVNQSIYNSYKKWEFIIVKNPLIEIKFEKCIIIAF